MNMLTELNIKNMVCNRCIKVVREELEGLGAMVKEISLGRVVIDTATKPDMQQIKNILEDNGFELLEDKKAQLIEEIKATVIELVQNDKLEKLRENISDYLGRRLEKDYHYLSQLFSSAENITLEKYIILQKVERIKELLIYDELTISEMAYRLGYSSSAHLSNQFRQVTGLSPSAFKQLKGHNRKPLDEV